VSAATCRFGDSPQNNVAQLFLAKAAETGFQARVVHKSILKQEAVSDDLHLRIKSCSKPAQPAAPGSKSPTPGQAV
ncbi:hypothetical protein, partial [Hymenobacter defluvii]